ncbi:MULTISPECIES: hypothetical protein [unclassified Acidovorax]|uniref:hypothetical protein n=1 Tax=unclassified Acidovorax TaxID=2684926 RepID=UPI0006FD1C4C|nr:MULTISPECIES: hypothetical protein [unclassified Acidovorax]KRB26980.1 hypothetical protein ASD94_12175 [Acidovorax sp. Root70]PUA98807.1 hypothetical protein C8C99_3683 [Acidovorax sp. 107]
MKIHPTPTLLAVNAALAVGLAALWLEPSGQVRGTAWVAPVAIVPDIAQPSGIAAPKAADTSRFLAVLERPLFSPNRRAPPPAPVKVETVPEPDALANIQLQGVYSSGDGGGILAKIDGKDRRLAVGGALGMWTLKSIEGRDAAFARGEEIRVLRLIPSKLGAAVPAPMGTSGNSIDAQKSQGAVPAQVDDPVAKQEQERQERERARLALRNARRAEQGFPPVKE